MDRDHFGQIWTSSGQKWPRTTLAASETLSLYREKVRGWSMKNRSKCNFFQYSGQSNLRPSYGQRSFWPNMNVLRSKMAENNSGSFSNPVIIWRKGKGVVHEKSVKSQCLQILLQKILAVLIWTEIILAKYDHPQVKNGRAQLWLLQRPYHYMEKR